jgi:hypothetical protein
MRGLRRYVTMTGLALGLAILAACGASATATLEPLATAAPTAIPRPGTVAAVRPSGAPATVAAPSPIPTATPAGSPVATVTRTGTAGTTTPPQAAMRLQQLGNSRQSWVLGGFTIAGLSGDLRPVFDYNGGDRRVTLTASGTSLAAYQIGGALYVNVPLIGVVQADSNSPLAAPAQALFAAPPALLAALVPSNVPYAVAGGEGIDGRRATRYTASVALPDLGVIDPSLAGQSGTAATTAWVDDAGGYLVALNADIAANSATTTASARLAVTAVGQTPAIVVPR